MTAAFVKRYRDPALAASAAAHHRWMATLPVRTPALLAASDGELVFEHLGHRHPGPEHLAELAAVLGRMHATAHTTHLAQARLDRPHTVGGLVIDDFVSPRRHVLARTPLPPDVAQAPAAFYKDANIRNFLLTDAGVAVIDFDDLTLAPFGYDLAKLILSTAMTYGRLSREDIERARSTYNAHTPERAACSLPQLQHYIELHHQLTIGYLHRNGYRHSWADMRPWSQPLPQPQSP